MSMTSRCSPLALAMIGVALCTTAPVASYAADVLIPTKSPDATTTGTKRNAKLKIINGDLIITRDNSVYDGVDVRGFVIVQAQNVTIKNSIIRGGRATTQQGLINAVDAKVKNLRIENNYLIPTYPSIWVEGIRGHHYTAIGNDIKNVVDGFSVLNTSKTKPELNVVIAKNYVHALAYFSPCSYQKDNRTHNDGIQIHGGTGVKIVGNAIRVFASQSAGNAKNKNVPAPDDYYPSVTGSGIAITPITGPVTNVLIDHNWLDYGSQTITGAVGSYGSQSSVTITYNKFGENQPLVNKNGVRAKRAVMLDPALKSNLVAQTGTDKAGNVSEVTGKPITVYRIAP